MMNYPIDGALAAAESAFEIDLLNKVIGTTYPQAAVYGTNTLGQVLQEYAIDIGVNPHDSKIHFENKRTGASTSDTNETVEGLGLQEGDVLAISDNAGVAADEDAFEIGDNMHPCRFGIDCLWSHHRLHYEKGTQRKNCQRTSAAPASGQCRHTLTNSQPCSNQNKQIFRCKGAAAPSFFRVGNRQCSPKDGRGWLWATGCDAGPLPMLPLR